MTSTFPSARNANRRTLLLRTGAVAALGALAWPLRAATSTPAPLVEIWKSPTCGCCHDWIRHLEASGFRTRTFDTGNAEARVRLGMPQRLGSCHTARVEGYVLEGHVPATDIKRLLRERPKALGLAVPAMPVGSPGMDGPEYGGRRDPYDVLLVAADGGTLVYQHYQ